MPSDYGDKRKQRINALEGVSSGGGKGTPTNGQGVPITKTGRKPGADKFPGNPAAARAGRSVHNARQAKRTRASGRRRGKQS